MGCSCSRNAKVGNLSSPPSDKPNRSKNSLKNSTKDKSKIDNRNRSDIRNASKARHQENDDQANGQFYYLSSGFEEEDIPSLSVESIDSLPKRKAHKNRSHKNKSSSSESSLTSYSSIGSSVSSIDSNSGSVSLSYAGIEGVGYKFVRTLGHGASSTVVEMQRGNRNFAVKVCQKNSSTNNIFNRNKGTNDPKDEIVIMRRFTHPNVIKMYDFYEDDSEKKIFIVMELLTGGNISRCTTIEQKKVAFAQAVSALQYIHFQRIAHKDIKVDNILRAEDGSIRIADFGISELVPEGIEKVKTEMKGTPAYLAPEMFGENSYDPFSADVWSLGITLYFVLFSKLPFIAGKLADIQRKVTAEDVKFPEGTDRDAQDLIRKMLKKNPTNRIKLSEIWEHPWMKGMKKIVEQNETLITSGEKLYKNITPGLRKNSINRISTNNMSKVNLEMKM
ncbi:calcium/calmodulin-dependent protein kinase kinase 2, beta [Tritrichomonas foetus]|uniref:Calcium/calmodulin-dependent protein kinase kinase 2, beta n=1 Tax=Tritrichomonas foetus TaxID=1144522 RepID=A0A1J4KJG4_9EUKA|nr:calcium/calmodulin-dependent protein kinase kinase 2, beta [Tritrichomonas foetus]|eukprot:OHT09493.1 calcium/calmodulin-dependent protein kinase kinase 2, beta [Tritrichomonas foetus]